MSAEGGTFDLRALFGAIDVERQRRGLTWSAVAEQVRVAASTFRRLADADDAEADGVLALVRWLGVAPEVFVVDATVAGEQLRAAGDGFVRVDLELVAEADGDRGGARGRTRRLACGASISTVTRHGRSILDVTQATPTITVGQRRALLVRDPHQPLARTNRHPARLNPTPTDRV